MADAQFDIRQAGEPVQPLFPGRGLVGGPGQLQVEPGRAGRRAHLGRVPRARGQVGQPLGQLQLLLLGIREAEHPDQFLPGGGLGLPGRGQAGGRIGVKSLLAGVLQPAEVAHLLQAAGQFGADLAHLVHLLRIHQPLPGGHRPHPSPADGGDRVHCVQGQAHLRQLDAAHGRRVAQRQGEQVEQAEGEGALELDLVRQGGAGEHEPGIGDAAGLGRAGRLGPVAGEHGLDGRAVDQGEMDRVLLIQGAGEQGRGCFRHGRALFVGLGQGEVAVGEPGRGPVGPRQRLLEVHPGAAGKGEQHKRRRQQDRQQGPFPVHGWPPWSGGWVVPAGGGRWVGGCSPVPGGSGSAASSR